MRAPSHAIGIHPRTAALLLITSTLGVVAFTWPLLAAPGSSAMAHSGDSPIIFAALIPLLLGIVLASFREGGLDAKAIAILGVLSAVIAVLRPIGAGTAGLEPIWVVLILGGRAMGPGFGFALGSVGLFASALLTGGVGPWLPFQMLAASWVGLGAGLLPAVRGRREIAMMATYGAVASLLYGLIMNLWFWPFTGNLPPGIGFTAGAALSDNLTAWLRFTLVTSLGYDIPRAILTAALIGIAGAPILFTLRRLARKANFSPTVAFTQQEERPSVHAVQQP
jgi:energy-coupling factor transport system substrate-specific component